MNEIVDKYLNRKVRLGNKVSLIRLVMLLAYHLQTFSILVMGDVQNSNG